MPTLIPADLHDTKFLSHTSPPVMVGPHAPGTTASTDLRTGTGPFFDLGTGT